MGGLNKVMIMGNLGADPDVKYLSNGSAVTHIRVATSESWKDRQTGERQERTEWHRISLFNRIGEVAAQYLRKGSKVFIEGALKTTKWQDQGGQDRYSTDIIASNMQMMDSKGAASEGFDAAPGSSAESADHYQRSSSAAPTKAAPVLTESYDDEIPF